MHPSKTFVPRCILLFAVLYKSSIVGASSDDSSEEVVWLKPAKNGTFISGNPLIAQFNSEKNMASPAFQLCSCDGDCGDLIWPDVKQSSSDFSWSATLSVPSVTKEGCYFLKMKDDFGDCGPSPEFSISPSGPSRQDPSVADRQSPSLTSSASVQDSSTPVATQQNVFQSPMSIPSSGPSDAPLVNAATSTPNLLATRVPPPTAAFAVPLSIVGAILLVAGGVFIRHNRKLGDERAKEVEKLKSELNSMSRTSSFASYRSRRVERDLERGLESNNVPLYGSNTMPVPLFLPMGDFHDPRDKAKEPRRSTRQAYSDFRPPPYLQSVPFTVMPYGYNYDPQSIPPSYRSHRSSRSNTISSVSSSFSSASCESTNSHSRRPKRTNATRYPPSLQSRPPRHDQDDGCNTVTGSVIGDYLDPSPKEKGRKCELVPPECLLTAPQKLHVRNEAAIEFEDMVEVDLYDAVANSLRTYQRQ